MSLTEKKNNNPLTPMLRKQQAQPSMSGVKAHAHVWQHVSKLPQHEHEDHIDVIGYGLPILGRLAHDPKVKQRDVIKAVADAAGARKIEPSKAIALISAMPPEPEKLRPWLLSIYAFNMSALIHLKAMSMPGLQPFSPPSAPAAMQQAQAPATPPQRPPAAPPSIPSLPLSNPLVARR